MYNRLAEKLWNPANGIAMMQSQQRTPVFIHVLLLGRPVSVSSRPGKGMFCCSFPLSCHDPTSLVSNAHKLLTIQHSEGSRPVIPLIPAYSRAFETRRAPAPFFYGWMRRGVRGAVWRCSVLFCRLSLVWWWLRGWELRIENWVSVRDGLEGQGRERKRDWGKERGGGRRKGVGVGVGSGDKVVSLYVEGRE